MKLAVYQAPPTDGDVEAAFRRLEAQLRAAAIAGADILVAPELYLPGYNRFDFHTEVTAEDGEHWRKRLSGLARGAGTGLVVGWAERAEGRLWNAATVFDAQGREQAHYRKIQPYGPDESRTFEAGSHYALFPLQDRSTGLLICYDIEFPEHARALAAQGGEVLLVPTANPAGFSHVPDVLVRARAAESGVAVAYANYVGVENGLTYGGGSVIVGPDGAILAAAGLTEALLVAELPPRGETEGMRQFKARRVVAGEQGLPDRPDAMVRRSQEE